MKELRDLNDLTCQRGGRLTGVLQRAGGGAQVWVNILLVVLLLSLLAYIYTTLHNRDMPEPKL